MSFGSRRILIGMGVGAVMLAVYLTYALGPKAPGLDDAKSWALAMLIFIAVTVVVVIVVEILYHILFSIGYAIKQRRQDVKVVEGEIKATVAEDERDKQINLKSARVGYRTLGLGILAVLVALAFGLELALALHLMFAVVFLSCFVEGIAGIIYHERGI